MKKTRVVYVVNLDATTSIPLEVAAELHKYEDNIKTVVYYKDSKYPPNPFTRDIENLELKKGNLFSNVKTVYKFLKKWQPEVIHAHHTISSLIFFVVARLVLKNVILIKTEHNNHNFFKPYQSFINFFILLLSDKILCNSENTHKSFSKIEQLVTKNKVTIVHNGVNTEFINNQKLTLRTAKKYNAEILLREDIKVVGSVGRIVEQKNYETLLTAFHQLTLDISFQNTYLVIVGDGDKKNILEELIHKLKLEDKVILTGAVSREEVYAFLSKFDVFVMTSLWEGFCNTVVEAMAAGKPIVCTDIPTLREVVKSAGVFVPIRDKNGFAQAIKESLSTDEETRKVSTDISLKIAMDYSIEKTAKKYISYYGFG
ncbi:MAG: glycosyltransferase [Saprospiraceae bacterium]